ncbi:MAG: FMN-binding protein, partial [Oscillospiraceae bacterium]|nr:FMN-binding protein [Oscillospiraceae bacterium]
TTPEPSTAPANTPEPTPEAPAGIYNPGTYTGTATGFQGDIVVKVTVDDNKITAITVDESANSNQLLSDSQRDDIAKAIVSAQSTNVDGVAGCTLSSNGIKAAVDNALSQAKR